MVAMMAGADFIKTSTGKEAVNATLPIGLCMIRAIQKFYSMTGKRVSKIPSIYFTKMQILPQTLPLDRPQASWWC